MRARVALVSIALVAASASGCVKKSTYKTMQSDLQSKIDERDGQIKELEQTVADRDGTIEEHKATVKRLEGTVQEKGETIASRDKEIERINGELAAVVKDRSRLKQSASDLRTALVEESKRKAQAEKRVAQFRSLLSRFKKLIDTGKLKVKVSQGRMVLELATDVLFDSGKADLSTEGRLAVAEVAKVLATIEGRLFQIEGHTDNVPIRSSRFASNWELAAARANNVVHAMIEAGMKPEALSAASYGQFRPVAANDTEVGRASNRRIEIVLVPDLSGLPGFDELQGT